MISGSNTGIYVYNSSTVSGGITNSGLISGGAYAIYVDGAAHCPTSTSPATTPPSFIGEVYAPNTTVTVVSGAVYTMINGNLFTVDGTGGFTNAGTLGVEAGGIGTIAGNYTQTAGGTFQTYVTSNSHYGQLLVTGTAALPSTTNIFVNVASSNTLAIGQTISGVISAGTITGAGAFAVTDNSALFDFVAAKETLNPNAIDLTVKIGLTAVGSVNSNGNTDADGAAAVIDTLLNGSAHGSADMGTVTTALGKLTTQQEVSNAVRATLPLLTGGMAHATSDVLHGVNKIVQARQDENHGLSSGEDFVTNRNAWVKPIGSWANQSDANGTSGYKAQTYGVAMGADGELSQVSRIGAALAITHSNVDNNLGSQSAGVDSYQAVLYGSRVVDDKNTELNWQGDYGMNQNKGSRNITFMARTATASYTSNSFHLGAGVGRTLAMNETTSFTPSIRADYTTIRSAAYNETGAGAINLAVDSNTTNEFIVAVEGKVTHQLSDAATLIANLGIGYDTMAKQSSITAAYAGGGAAFTTLGITPSPTIVNGGVGVVMKSSKTVEVTARYDVEARTGFTDQTVSVKARWPF